MWVRGFMDYQDGAKLQELTQDLNKWEANDYEDGFDGAALLERWNEHERD